MRVSSQYVVKTLLCVNELRMCVCVCVCVLLSSLSCVCLNLTKMLWCALVSATARKRHGFQPWIVCLMERSVSIEKKKQKTSCDYECEQDKIQQTRPHHSRLNHENSCTLETETPRFPEKFFSFKKLLPSHPQKAFFIG
jgi:hypothetical protein